MTVVSDLDWVRRARKVEETWRKRARKVIDRYRDEQKQSDLADAQKRYNILWANTETMRPALFSSDPKADVRRRFQDKDPLAKAISEVVERGVDYAVDCEDFTTSANRGINDLLLPGRMVIRAKYVPTWAYGDPPKIQVTPVYNDAGEVKGYSDGENTYEEAQEGENGYYVEGDPEEEVVDESIGWERVPWDLFLRDPDARCWEDNQKIAFGAFMDRGDLVREFGRRKANKVQLTHKTSDLDEPQEGTAKEAKYALVWEIWDVRKREVRVVAEGYDDYLRKTPDPLKLQKFWPTPKPVCAVETNDDQTPVPLYCQYQDQAQELDLITNRLYRLIDALRVRGLYAGSDKDILEQLFNSEDNELVPVQNFQALADRGGLENMIAWLPIEQIQKVVIGLYQQREALIQQIYEITGMADIMRGATDPRETKGAQVLKAQFGGRRLMYMQREVARYFRDLYRIAAEIMCEHFSAETLQRITGKPVLPEMKQLMQDDAMRSYRIDIETDSTIAPDEQRDKEAAVEAITALGNFISMVAPLVQQGQLTPEAATEAAKWFVRKFRMGRDLEDFLSMMEQAPPQQPRDPEAEAKAQATMQKAQLDAQKAQLDAQLKQQEFQLKVQQMQMEMELERLKLEQELQIEREKAQAEEMRKNRESETKQVAMLESAKAQNQNVRVNVESESQGQAIQQALKTLTQSMQEMRRPRRVRFADGEEVEIN